MSGTPGQGRMWWTRGTPSGGRPALMAVLAAFAVILLFPAAGAAVPNPAGAKWGALLRAVTCKAPSNCWAVGNYFNDAFDSFNQALRWNGSKWSVIPTPKPGVDRRLKGVACTSAANCWAVGDYTNSAGAHLNQILRWNGTKWTLRSTPNPGGTAAGADNELAGVTCISASNCWAVGVRTSGSGEVNEVLHWNGTKWTLSPTPNPGGTAAGASNALAGVACVSATNCWAVGSYGHPANDSYLNEVLHWNGTKWTLSPTPNPGGTTRRQDDNSLLGVACTSAANCWAVGGYSYVLPNHARGAELNQILHWNGANWSLSPAPNPTGTKKDTGNELAGVTCTSAANCWAVGTWVSGFEPGDNEALHWNGTKWTLTPAHHPAGTTQGHLDGVACTSAANCWAVGSSFSSSLRANLNEALLWNGTKWSPR